MENEREQVNREQTADCSRMAGEVVQVAEEEASPICPACRGYAKSSKDPRRDAESGLQVFVRLGQPGWTQRSA